jgi:hypothetical protein
MSYTQEDIEELILSYVNDESLIPSNYHASSQPDMHSVYVQSICRQSIDGYVYKSGDSENVNDRYKGVNAAVLAEEEGTIDFTNTVIHSTAVGGDAIVVYENGTANLLENVIYTDKDRSAALVASEDSSVIGNEVSILTKETNSPAALIIKGGIELNNSSLYTEKSPVVETNGRYTTTIFNSTLYGNETNPEILFKNGDSDTYNYFNLENCILGGNGSSVIRSEDTVLGSKDIVNLKDVSVLVSNPNGYFITANNGTIQVNLLESQMEERDNLATATGDSQVSIYTDTNVFGKITAEGEAKITLNVMDKTILAIIILYLHDNQTAIIIVTN